MKSSIPAKLRNAVQARDDRACRYCRLTQVGQGATFHIDHVLPRSKRGQTVLDNLVLQCPHCSLRKSNKTEAADPVTGQTCELFNPVRQDWDEHFELRPDGTIVGLSTSGRATVEALHMNAVLPRTARAYQLTLGLLRASRGQS